MTNAVLERPAPSPLEVKSWLERRRQIRRDTDQAWRLRAQELKTIQFDDPRPTPIAGFRKKCTKKPSLPVNIVEAIMIEKIVPTTDLSGYCLTRGQRHQLKENKRLQRGRRRQHIGND